MGGVTGELFSLTGPDFLLTLMMVLYGMDCLLEPKNWYFKGEQTRKTRFTFYILFISPPHLKKLNIEVCTMYICTRNVNVSFLL